MKNEPAIQDQLVKLRRELHQHPELGFEEHTTRKILINALQEQGFKVHGPVAKTGFYVDIEGSRPGPAIAYRADMDALPIGDQKEVEYASKNEGKGHMCGHDVHSTIAFGIATLLKQNREELQGKVRVFWQPAEEINPSGAPEVIKAGILDEFDAVYGIHCDPRLESGSVCILSGMVSASFDKFDITLKAPASMHSARPHLGSDTIWVANKVITELYSLPGRITNALYPFVISVSMIHGGKVHNVIPQEVNIGGTIRCAKHSDREIIQKHIEHLLASFSEIYELQTDLELGKGAPPVRNDDTLAGLAKQVVSNEEEFTLADCNPSMGGEDFAHYSLHKPTLFMRLGTSSGPETSHAVHTPFFDIDEKVLEPAVGLIGNILMDRLQVKQTIS